jgi:hypothetical protein
MAVEKFGKHPETGRTMCLLEIDSLEDWPENLRLPKSRHFVLFLALDAKGIPDEDVAAFATKALDQGMVYLSAWGRDAERVHDVCEEASAEWNPDSDVDDAILSEWHEGEPLSQALLYSVSSAAPANDYEGTCAVTLAVSVGNPDWAEQVREWLEDPKSLEKASDERETLPPTSGGKGGDEDEEADADAVEEEEDVDDEDDEDDDLDDEEEDEEEDDDD